MPAGLHTLFALSKQVRFAGEALMAALSSAGLTGRVARLTLLLRLFLIEARGAFCYTGAVCMNGQIITKSHKTQSQMLECVSGTRGDDLDLLSRRCLWLQLRQ